MNELRNETGLEAKPERIGPESSPPKRARDRGEGMAGAYRLAALAWGIVAVVAVGWYGEGLFVAFLPMVGFTIAAEVCRVTARLDDPVVEVDVMTVEEAIRARSETRIALRLRLLELMLSGDDEVKSLARLELATLDGDGISAAMAGLSR